MRQTKKSPQPNSLRTLLIFCGIVVILVLISSLFRLLYLIQHSQFSGENRFTIAFVGDSKELNIVSLDPNKSTLSHLEINGVKNVSDAKMQVGVFTDTTIYLHQSYDPEKRVASYLMDSLLHKKASSSLSSFDLIRLALATGSISPSTIDSEEITLPLDHTSIEQITQKLFFDTELSSDNKTIEIVNGTGIPGLGGRLERALTTMGANVISVTNADKKQQRSQLKYFGDKTYTVERLEKLLGMDVQKKEGKSLSDIIIVIGEDKEETISY